jgi:hypothetical protein
MHSEKKWPRVGRGNIIRGIVITLTAVFCFTNSLRNALSEARLLMCTYTVNI